MIKVRESKCWVNNRTGAQASIYGACPYWSEAEAADWEVKSVGWTWEHPNGTIGMGRPPAKTREEAQAVADNLNQRFHFYCHRMWV